MELSGLTTANWVAKSANLLVDTLDRPQRVGLLLPLHWQSVVVLLAGVATGATVVVADHVRALAGCDAAFTTAQEAEAALDVGVEDVLAVSLHPLGAPLPSLPPLVLDHAREVPGHGDHWSGPAPGSIHIQVAGRPLGPLPALGLGSADRVLCAVALADPAGLALLLGCLAAGAALVLVPDPSSLDLATAVMAERATAAVGLHRPGLVKLQ